MVTRRSTRLDESRWVRESVGGASFLSADLTDAALHDVDLGELPRLVGAVISPGQAAATQGLESDLM